MKAKFLLTLSLFLTLTLFSQTRIKMKKENGVYKIPCVVNGLRLKFIFDTGASNVCISLSEARLMLENGYLDKKDIIGIGKSQIADGSIVNNTRIILREININGLILKNVEAIIINELGAPLLLGQSAIEKLGKIQIEGDEIIILNSQSTNKYKPNEKLVYAAYYNINGSMTHLAQVTMQTELTQTSNKNFIHLSWEAATFSQWDSFFKIRDLYETYVDEMTLKPCLFKRNMSEGGYSIVQKYIYSLDGNSIKFTSKVGQGHEITKMVSIRNSSQDIISLIYNLRTIDFNRFFIGQSRIFSLIFDDKEYPILVKLLGSEIISAGDLGKRKCNILSISANTDKLKGIDKNLIWMTADSISIPVQVKFSIPVGTGQISLLNASGI